MSGRIAKQVTDENGVVRIVAQPGDWRPFSVTFDTDDGEFSFHLWAVSFDHAEMRLRELKASARVTGMLESSTPES